MDKYDYAREKFQTALIILVSDNPIKKRLEGAIHTIWHLDKEQVPSNILLEIKILIEELSKNKTRQGYYMPDTINDMTIEDAEVYCQRIYQLCKDMDMIDMMCCGNCGNHVSFQEEDYHNDSCKKGFQLASFEYCEQWSFDDLSRKARTEYPVSRLEVSRELD